MLLLDALRGFRGVIACVPNAGRRWLVDQQVADVDARQHHLGVTVQCTAPGAPRAGARGPRGRPRRPAAGRPWSRSRSAEWSAGPGIWAVLSGTRISTYWPGVADESGGRVSSMRTVLARVGDRVDPADKKCLQQLVAVGHVSSGCPIARVRRLRRTGRSVSTTRAFDSLEVDQRLVGPAARCRRPRHAPSGSRRRTARYPGVAQHRLDLADVTSAVLKRVLAWSQRGLGADQRSEARSGRGRACPSCLHRAGEHLVHHCRHAHAAWCGTSRVGTR